MSEPPPTLQQHPSHAAVEIGQVLELLEVAWERGRSMLDTAPLTAAQTRVLYIIEREPGLNLSSLGRRLSAAAPSVTRLCDRLQAVGFLHRSPHPHNGRETRLELTDAGTAHLRGVRLRREQALRRALSRMPTDAQHALASGLSALCTAVSEPVPAAADRHTA
ncbi:MarR family transcriptional regulator [Streptomyces sp. G-G2]|uniref:MarR family winged helix-turn-helix transcriptional regulator n=1 Tax=Streptomyces sp. G-G2 TaxID=3046201 RepID=UPI0024BBB20F|nr:MarR family transcriptional regulator [Streptomyces sp. G-G2]MDJ0380452.1 MarR family transcriptional regulator [Streptomyces sp. G-G2]